MTRDVFQSWLEKGLGRAVLFLRENDDLPYHDLIVHACTHNMAFDRQTESRDAVYYFDLMQATKDPVYYRDRLLASLLAPLEGEYSYQMLEIAGLLAKSGDEGARKAMYADFTRDDSREMGCADLLVELDGYAALQFMAEHRPVIDPEEDDWELHKGVEILEKRFGEAEAWPELERMAAENSVIAAWVEIVKQTRAKWKETRETARPKRPALSYEELKALIAEKGRKLYAKAWFWHKKAKPEDLAQAARDLLTETNPDSLIAYLRIFSKCGFPLDPAPIIALAKGEDEEVARAALLALEHTTHFKVRQFALACIAEARHLGFVVDMLAANYEPGDSATIAKLTETPLDADDYHSLQRGARHFVEKRWDEFSVPILLNLYENGPCSLCRHSCVKLLIEHDALPDWMRDEARYDADEDTRALFTLTEENRGKEEIRAPNE